MGVLKKVCLILLISGGRGCRSRSGEDNDRVYSHQGEEPEYVREKAEAGARVEAGADINAEDETRQREEGEYKVGKKWEFPVAQTRVGMIWGTIEESRQGKRILAFRGIKQYEQGL